MFTQLDSYQTEAYAKWLLTGEHAVIRGYPAIVFPLKSRLVKFNYEASDKPLSIHCEGFSSNQIESSLPELLDEAYQLLSIDSEKLKGSISIQNSIPSSSGLGLSAALSVCITRLLHHALPDKIQSEFQFAKSLEDLFHKKSSGVDVAGSMIESPACYVIDQTPKQFELKHQYYFTLHDTHQPSQTKACVEKVMRYLETTPIEAKAIDAQMGKSAEMALEAFSENNYHNSLLKLKEAFEIAANCFKSWDLVPESINEKMQSILEEGALAVKPTGSGSGGYLLSLWENEPSSGMLV